MCLSQKSIQLTAIFSLGISNAIINDVKNVCLTEIIQGQQLEIEELSRPNLKMLNLSTNAQLVSGDLANLTCCIQSCRFWSCVLIQALKQQLNIQLFYYVIFWSLSPLPDTWSVFWQRVGVPNTKHGESRLFQAPLPTLDEIHGIEMSIVVVFLITRFSRLTLCVHIFLKSYILWEVEETYSGLRHIAKITVRINHYYFTEGILSLLTKTCLSCLRKKQHKNTQATFS